jgi:predicted Zn-dependent protease
MSRVHRTFALGLVALASVAGCAMNPYTGKTELSLISREQEIDLGRQAAPQFEAEFAGRVADPRVQGYVRGVGLRVSALSDRAMPYDFAVLNSTTPNAFALPGGPIYITKGLLKAMQNERELAAVLAHEVGHIAAKHSVNGLQRRMGAAILIEVVAEAAGSQGATAGKIAEIVLNLKELQYSREDEYQADEAGIVYMTRAGYNPYGMVEMLTTLQGLSQTEPGRLAEMFSTHPLTSRRVEDARGIVQRKFPAVDPRSADPNAPQFLEVKAMLK